MKSGQGVVIIQAKKKMIFDLQIKILEISLHDARQANIYNEL